MVAKVLVIALIIAAFLFGALWLYLKYVLPHVRDLKKERERTQRKQLERDEKLVEEAEREYRE